MTMKKLKTPMYKPIFCAGRLSDSSAYGSESTEAHAKPTPSIASSNQFGSRMTRKDSSAAPPSHTLMRWVRRRPSLRTINGMTVAASAANPL